MTIQEMYQERITRWHSHSHCDDIHEHLPTLREYAVRVKHITEFGTRTGNSTTAFLAGLSVNGGEMQSYDIAQTTFASPEIPNVVWSFHKQDTGAKDFQIAPTDILFIDSLHEFPHVMRELRQADKVRRYIIFHDTAIDWIASGGRGPIDAVTAFLARSPHWGVKEIFENNNGMTVLERK